MLELMYAHVEFIMILDLAALPMNLQNVLIVTKILVMSLGQEVILWQKERDIIGFSKIKNKKIMKRNLMIVETKTMD